jgi:hypothetical protein
VVVVAVVTVVAGAVVSVKGCAVAVGVVNAGVVDDGGGADVADGVVVVVVVVVVVWCSFIGCY